MDQAPTATNRRPLTFTAHADGWALIDAVRRRCALGEAGVLPAGEKREGDGASPAGAWPLRRLLIRADRLQAPPTRLSVTPLRRNDGWCDALGDRNYNRPVVLPYPASAEALWRDDHLYDLIVVLGHNDDPVIQGAGSAVFLHVAAEGYPPTRGCVALARPDLEALVAIAGPGDILVITAAPSGRSS